MSATDADTGANAHVTYRILKGAFDDFTIDTNTGVVSLSATSRLDYDRRSSYLMEVTKRYQRRVQVCMQLKRSHFLSFDLHE